MSVAEDPGVGEDTWTGNSGPDAQAVVGLSGEHLATILSEAWTNRGWETDVVEDDDGTFLVTGDKGTGQRGLILVLPGAVEVPGKRLQQYATLVDEKSVDVRVVATQGEFTEDAERIANANDVHLLDPRAVLETVEAEGLEDTLGRYATDGGTSGGGIGAALAGLPIPLPSPGRPGRGGLPTPGGKGLKSVLLVALIATSLLAGFAGGAFLTPATGGAGVAPAGLGGDIGALVGGLLGSDGGRGDLAVAALSTAPPDDAGISVRWNAQPADTVMANGSTYEPPTGTRFLVVEFAVTNTGSDRIPVRGDDFLVHANGTRYANQPLDGARTFETAALAPGESTTGWLVYAIPADASDAVLVPDPDAAGGPTTVTHDTGLTVNGTA